MRVLLLSIMMIAVGAFAKADSSLWKKSCLKGKGLFATLKDGKDELPVCFFGEAVVGAKSWSQLEEEGVNAEALKAYKNRRTAPVRGGVCGAFDAELLVVKDAKGTVYNFCRFEDNSVMEETTLWLGPGTAISDSLDKALSKINVL